MDTKNLFSSTSFLVCGITNTVFLHLTQQFFFVGVVAFFLLMLYLQVHFKNKP